MRSMTENSDAEVANALAEYSQSLRQGVLSGLAYLNARVPHRFTTINRFQSDWIHCLYLFDKRGAVTPEHVRPVAMGSSFCQFVARDGFFMSCDTAEDSRLDGHPNQGVYRAYVGVPVLDNSGQLWGTLCHLDLRESSIGDEEFDFLQRASRELSKYLKFQ